MQDCRNVHWQWRPSIEVDKRLMDIDFIGTVALTQGSLFHT